MQSSVCVSRCIWFVWSGPNPIEAAPSRIWLLYSQAGTARTLFLIASGELASSAFAQGRLEAAASSQAFMPRFPAHATACLTVPERMAGHGLKRHRRIARKANPAA